MTPEEIRFLANAFANVLVSNAAHGLATSSLDGMGEITLRDGLIVAAASVASERRQAWLLEREVMPIGWKDATVDLIISRQGRSGNTSMVAGVELKWWRHTDAGNASNRRRDLIRDFFRAAALDTLVEDIAFVALLSTAGSWGATASTKGSDEIPIKMLGESGNEQWNTSIMVASSAVRGAVASLRGKVPICNIFHTRLLTHCGITVSDKEVAFARVWSVKKPQNTRFLTDDEVSALI